MKITQNPKTKLATVINDEGKAIKLHGLLHATSTKAQLLDEDCSYAQDMLKKAIETQDAKLIRELVFLDSYQLAAVEGNVTRLEEQRPVSQELKRTIWRENKAKVRKTTAKSKNEVPEKKEA